MATVMHHLATHAWFNLPECEIIATSGEHFRPRRA